MGEDANREEVESSCINLLKAMEIEDREDFWEEVVEEAVETEEENLNLPKEWLYDYTEE